MSFWLWINYIFIILNERNCDHWGTLELSVHGWVGGCHARGGLGLGHFPVCRSCWELKDLLLVPTKVRAEATPESWQVQCTFDPWGTPQTTWRQISFDLLGFSYLYRLLSHHIRWWILIEARLHVKPWWIHVGNHLASLQRLNDRSWSERPGLSNGPNIGTFRSYQCCSLRILCRQAE